MRLLRSMSIAASVVAGVALACGETLPNEVDTPTPTRDSGVEAEADSTAGGDATVDAAPPPKCDHLKPFNQAVPIGELNSPAQDTSPHLTDDELRIVFQTRREDGGAPKFYVAERESRTEPFKTPEPFPLYELGDTDPVYSGDGLALYFAASRGAADYNLWSTERLTLGGNWSIPKQVNGLASTDNEFQPFFRAGGLWYTRLENSPTRSIWFSKNTSGAFAMGTKVAELDAPDVDDELPTPSADGLSLYFASKRGIGETNIWFARREKTSDPFASAVAVQELNTSEIDVPSWLSVDGCRLYLVRGSTSDAGVVELDLYVAEKPAN
jgi:hypothetical protein